MLDELLSIIDHLENIVSKQNSAIAKLINENLEQENIINVMMREHID